MEFNENTEGSLIAVIGQKGIGLIVYSDDMGWQLCRTSNVSASNTIVYADTFSDLMKEIQKLYPDKVIKCQFTDFNKYDDDRGTLSNIISTEENIINEDYKGIIIVVKNGAPFGYITWNDELGWTFCTTIKSLTNCTFYEKLDELLESVSTFGGNISFKYVKFFN
jgi:hypothetical protein